MSFIAAPRELFFSRKDSLDIRLGDLVKLPPAPQSIDEFKTTFVEALRIFPLSRHFTIAGYPDDEGVRLNGGRSGAELGPNCVRRSLYRMTPDMKNQDHNSEFVLWDIGNLNVSEMDLAHRHDSALDYGQATLEMGSNLVSIGGGHDYAYADGAAYIEWCKSNGSRPLIINFDAHLDVRPVDDRGLNSGTAFYRLLDKYSATIDFAEIGIQGHCNSSIHYQWALSKGARILTMEDLSQQMYAKNNSIVSSVTGLLDGWIQTSTPRPAYISVDIDGFSSAIAPGASQSWATGFNAAEFFVLFNSLIKILDVRVLGIYEVSPPLDLLDQTSKLAAQIIHRRICSR
jgi:formiminoglutamase